jgi:hypothetical protein
MKCQSRDVIEMKLIRFEVKLQMTEMILIGASWEML